MPTLNPLEFSMHVIRRRDESEYQITYTGTKAKEHLVKLFDRALGSWEDAPAEFKEFADMLNHGRILQVYK